MARVQRATTPWHCRYGLRDLLLNPLSPSECPRAQRPAVPAVPVLQEAEVVVRLGAVEVHDERLRGGGRENEGGVRKR